MRPIRLAALLLLVPLLLVGPATVSAVTVDDIVALTRAGVSDQVILAMIDRDKTIFALESNQVVTLEQEGVSEAVVLAMIKSGREEAPPAAVAQTAGAALLPPPADVLIVGHGPDRPNTGRWDTVYIPPDGPPFVLPFIPPYARAGVVPGAVPRVGGSVVRHHTRSLCLAHVTPAGTAARTLSFITSCPAPIQPRVRVRPQP